MKGPKKIGLVWKLTGMVSLLLLITTVLICIIYIQTFRSAFLEDAKEQLETSLGRMQNNIDEGLDDAESFLDELFYGREFPYFLDAENVLSKNEIRYYVSNLDKDFVNARYLYQNRYSDLGIYSSNKQISQHYEWQFYLDDLKSKPYYQEISKNTDQNVYGAVRERGLISTTLDIKNLKMGDSGIRVLPIYRKVSATGTERLIGVVEIDVDVARLADKEALAAEKNEIGKLLLDGKYSVLFDTMSLSKEDRQRVSKTVDSGAKNGEVEIGGIPHLFAANVCSRTGLVSIAVLSKDDIMNNLMNQVLQILLIAAVCLGILAALTFYFVKNILQRLVVLDQMMGRVGKGDFTVEITDDGREDEITRITSSFNKMAGQLNDVLDEKVKHEQAQKDAELRALQAQINPHFLYNTLESMRMQCEIDEYYTISNSLSSLSNLFRYSIRWGNSEAPFQLEWKNLLDYLDIMKMRFDDDVEYDLYCDPGLEEISVPKLVLQPLVENCFNHGFKGKLPPWRLSVSAVRLEGQLKITITDNGAGIEPKRLERLQTCLKENKPFRSEEQKKNSIGVTNVKQRIDMICREGSNIWVESTEGKGTIIEIKIIC